MNATHSVVALVLLVGVCCAMLLGFPSQAQAALISCSSFGCPGGPDNCISATVMIRGVSLTFTCYIKVVQQQVQS
jgi:hypothetical protein